MIFDGFRRSSRTAVEMVALYGGSSSLSAHAACLGVESARRSVLGVVAAARRLGCLSHSASRSAAQAGCNTMPQGVASDAEMRGLADSGTLVRLVPEQELVVKLNANRMSGFDWKIDQSIDRKRLWHLVKSLLHQHHLPWKTVHHPLRLRSMTHWADFRSQSVVVKRIHHEDHA